VCDVKAGEIPGRSDAWQLAAKAGQMGAGRVFAVLITPNTPNVEISTRDAAKAASRTLGERIQVCALAHQSSLRLHFWRSAQCRPRVLLIVPDGSFNENAAQLLSFRCGAIRVLAKVSRKWS